MTFWVGLFVAVCVAAWVITDARARRMSNAFGYAVVTFFFAPIGLAAYLTRRPLRAGERREGGPGWNFCRYLALYWTALWVFIAISGFISTAASAPPPGSDGATAAGYAIGSVLGFGCVFVMWLVPMIVLLIVGLLLRKSSIVEAGPTGALAG